MLAETAEGAAALIASAGELERDHFARRETGLAWQLAGELVACGRLPDAVTLAHELQKHTRNGSAHVFLGSLLDGVPRSANLGAWADMVREAAEARGGLRDDAVLVRVSDVKPEQVTWLGRNRLPFGKLVVLDGDPGLGKSTITLDIVARASRGWSMPGDTRGRDPMTSVILTAEDGLADTVRPRLEGAGADLARVVVMTAARDADGRPRPPMIPDDVDALRAAIRKHSARLVVIDPLMAHLSGSIDSHRDQDVRRALSQLRDLAETTGAVLLVVRHLNKSTAGASAIYRGGGSIGIIGAARIGLLVGKDPKDPSRCILAVSKSNLGPIPASLAYRVVPVSEEEDAPIKIQWEGEADASARDLVQPGAEAGPDGALADAVGFLREVLAGGPLLTERVKEQASEAGIAWRTIERSKSEAGVRSRRKGFGGPWLLELKDAGDHVDRQGEEPTPYPQKDGGLWTVGGLREKSANQTSSEGSEKAPFPIDRVDRQDRQPPDPAVYSVGGVAYKPGDTVPSGKVVLAVDDGVPTFARAARSRGCAFHPHEPSSTCLKCGEVEARV